MVKIVLTTRSGRIYEREDVSGTLMHEFQGELDPWGQCGGSCACATCHIIVEEGWDHLEPADDDELGLLDMEPNSNEKSRLSCQIDVDDLPKDAILKIKVPHCD